MALIFKETLDGPDGAQPAISTGHHCRACRAGITGERFASLVQAEAWLRDARAERTMPLTPDTLIGDLPPDWWLDVECPCNPRGPVSLKISHLVARAHSEARLLGDVAARLKCVTRRRPVARVTLVDSPVKPEAGGWAPPATAQIRVTGPARER